MKKNLLYGIIGGAAVGAAASYLMSAKDRRNSKILAKQLQIQLAV
jgi:hypothetical protein